MKKFKKEEIIYLQDELQWDTLFKKTQKQLIATAQRARRAIEKGHAKPMDYARL